jgi:hypothetical protein
MTTRQVIVFINNCELSVVVHAYNPSSLETEAGGWRVQGQPELYSVTLS